MVLLPGCPCCGDRCDVPGYCPQDLRAVEAELKALPDGSSLSPYLAVSVVVEWKVGNADTDTVAIDLKKLIAPGGFSFRHHTTSHTTTTSPLVNIYGPVTFSFAFKSSLYAESGWHLYFNVPRTFSSDPSAEDYRNGIELGSWMRGGAQQAAFLHAWKTDLDGIGIHHRNRPTYSDLNGNRACEGSGLVSWLGTDWGDVYSACGCESGFMPPVAWMVDDAKAKTTLAIDIKDPRLFPRAGVCSVG